MCMCVHVCACRTNPSGAYAFGGGGGGGGSWSITLYESYYTRAHAHPCLLATTRRLSTTAIRRPGSRLGHRDYDIGIMCRHNEGKCIFGF